MYTSSCEVPLILVSVMELEFSLQIFEKYSNIKFPENLSSGSRVVPNGLTGMTKLTIAFRNFANAIKKKGAKNKTNLSRDCRCRLAVTKPHTSTSVISVRHNPLLFFQTPHVSISTSPPSGVSKQKS